jgi:hypothetical protein
MLSLRCTPLVKSWHLLQGFLLARFCRLVHRCHFNSCQIIRQLQVWLHQVCFLPLAHTQPAAFVVGPGFLPVPGKTVTNIISGQYLDLATLLAKPSDMRSPSPLIYIDGQVVVSQASKPARRLTDISQWMQAFAIYMLIMVTDLPSRAADLIRYQLLILRMYTQFDGLAWYNYDEAFRRDAAARHVVDWSGMHVELYNFHTLPLLA